MCGSLAYPGAVAVLVVGLQMDVIKTRLQMQSVADGPRKGAVEIATGIVRNEGWAGLYGGLLPVRSSCQRLVIAADMTGYPHFPPLIPCGAKPTEVPFQTKTRSAALRNPATTPTRTTTSLPYHLIPPCQAEAQPAASPTLSALLSIHLWNRLLLSPLSLLSPLACVRPCARDPPTAYYRTRSHVAHSRECELSHPDTMTCHNQCRR
jgi:hypothetical protein